ncbi:hypothetical protein [Enterococcus wangshanyuanii]|uniref:Uncharacterized protein n=1 Tax=Enterococcus wangshanyuanii TaxID=2005703 RepID=A0ABQ1NZT0_9ENTE|nr:hypothetical protein [Enterococcus wangshanyuanii]GGC88195.1 hypothetical protein GCM10011573_17250 [Enterococcus wangshanyuanii]
MTEKMEFEWKRQNTFYHQKVRRDNKFIETGKGNLLPLISESKDDYSLIIVDTKAGKEPFAKASAQEQIERLSMQKSEPVFAFYFPKTEGGKSSVNALIEWFQEIQEYLEG